jgi:PAS domain S-box-containing protein
MAASATQGSSAQQTTAKSAPHINYWLIYSLLAIYALSTVAIALYLHVLVGAGVLLILALTAFYAGEIPRKMELDARDKNRSIRRLRYMEARTRSILDAAPDGILTLDDMGIITSFNLAATRLFGYQPNEVIGHNITMLLAGAGRNWHTETVAGQVGTDEAKIMDFKSAVEGKRKDGSTFPMEPAISKIRLGDLYNYTYIVRDLTEHKRTEEALRRARDELELRVQERTAELTRANKVLQAEIADRKQAEKALDLLRRHHELILNSAGEGICGLDIEGAVTYLNPAAAVMLGWEIDEVLGRPFHAVLKHARADDPLSQQTQCPQCAAFQAEKVHLDERVFEKKDGATFPVEYSSTPIRERGKVIGAVVIFQDITERKLAEKAMRDSAARLKILSRQLLEAQEVERRRLARELHDEIGQALTAIKINLQAVQPLTEATGQPRLEENISIVDRTIHQVRHLSLDLRPSILDDLGLEAALRWYMDRQAQRTGFVVHLDTDSVGARVQPDIETTCFRVVQEALTNVVRHAQARRVEIELRHREAELDVVIRDDGVGFDVPAAWRRVARSASLGLLGMQERVHLVGGTLTIHSAPTAGTEIRMRLPLAAPAVSDEATRGAPAS